MLSVNEYFDGKVKSIGFQTETLPATVGVMQAGKYEFSTSEKETMTVISGVLRVKLPDAEEFTSFHAGSVFTVEANKTFALEVDVDSAYLCTYG